MTAPALTHADLKNIVRYDRQTGRWFWRPSPAAQASRKIAVPTDRHRYHFRTVDRVNGLECRNVAAAAFRLLVLLLFHRESTPNREFRTRSPVGESDKNRFYPSPALSAFGLALSGDRFLQPYPCGG
jgi:hypothetical protein